MEHAFHKLYFFLIFTNLYVATFIVSIAIATFFSPDAYSIKEHLITFEKLFASTHTYVCVVCVKKLYHYRVIDCVIDRMYSRRGRDKRLSAVYFVGIHGHASRIFIRFNTTPLTNGALTCIRLIPRDFIYFFFVLVCDIPRELRFSLFRT